MEAHDQRKPISFNDFLELVADQPQIYIRSVFQVFHDMVVAHVGEGFDEYPDDPESIGFIYYDCASLLAHGTDRPFFADRLFANRLVNLAKALRQGAQQNKIYIFEGPPGCGKSTFLNNLLLKFEAYTNTEDGMRYETVWRLDRKTLGGIALKEAVPYFESLHSDEEEEEVLEENGTVRQRPSMPVIHETEEYVEIPCPCHDNPILMIPKTYRREFFDNIFIKNDKFKWKLFTEKEYEWVFRERPCTICNSIYKAVLAKLENPEEVLKMLYAQPYIFDRRLGEGISVFNPGDKPLRRIVLTNEMLQRRLDMLLKDSNRVRYVFSNFARTNNGIYALMDIKTHNKERLIELHNIVSEGVHKVEHVEENVQSLFLALMNPEDKTNIANIQSFMDRIQYIRIPYVLDINTEVEIYRNIFGKHIDANFLPKVLHNFARVIISSRLKKKSEGLLEWIEKPEKYERYCDKNLQLLKMEIYTGYIPPWLEEDDLRRFTAKRRKRIIAESEGEGEMGFSGRDSIKIFHEFYATYASDTKLITMSMLRAFFEKIEKAHPNFIPEGLINSLCSMYDYSILQEVKESLYYFNEKKIATDIQDYIFALNFETGTEVKSPFTGKKIEVTEEFFSSIENYLLGEKVDSKIRADFRGKTQKQYTSRTLTRDILIDNKSLDKTELFESLKERYLYNLKEKALDPFLENENFSRAIKDFEEESFKTYDRKIREDVTYLINNLTKKYRYTQKGAKEVCIYVIDNDLAKKFSKT